MKDKQRKQQSCFLRRLLAVFLCVILLVSLFPTENVSAASKVKLNKTKTTMYLGNPQTLKIVGTNKKVTWSSSNKKIATVSSNGKVTPKKEGKVTITAKVSKKKYKCVVTVKKPSINIKEKTIYTGQSFKLKLVGTKIKTVKSSKKSIATVEDDGTVLAERAGVTTITLVGKNGKKYTCKVTVKKPYLNYKKKTLKKGETFSLKLNGRKVVGFLSDDEDIVTVNSKGKVKALKSGVAKIKVEDIEGNWYECVVTVEAREQDTSINYENVTLYYGNEVWQENYDYFHLEISEIVGEKEVEWSSSNSDIATVDADGDVTVKEYGNVTIYADVGYKKFSCKFNIVQLKVYFGRKYTDSRLSEQDRIRWLEDGSFCLATGDTIPYKIVILEYDENGSFIKETDVTQEINIVPEVDGFFDVDVKNGTIKALKDDTNQTDRSSNISAELVSYDNGFFKQRLTLKVFTSKDKTKYIESLYSYILDSWEKIDISLKTDRFTLRARSNWRGGCSCTHDDVMIANEDWYLYDIPEGDITWESSNEDVILVEGSYGSNQFGYAQGDIRVIGKGNAILYFKYKGRIMDEVQVTVGDYGYIIKSVDNSLSCTLDSP